MACIALYTYNLLAVYVNLMIPINISTILVTTVFGVPGLFVLVLFRTFL